MQHFGDPVRTIVCLGVNVEDVSRLQHRVEGVADIVLLDIVLKLD